MVLTHNVYSSAVLLQVYQNQELDSTNGLHFLSLGPDQPKKQIWSISLKNI